MSLATLLFKAGILPICAIIISLAPFTAFSQPQTSLLAHNHNNAPFNTDTRYAESLMTNANVSVSNFCMLSESGESIVLLHLPTSSGNQEVDRAISSSLGLQAKSGSWMAPEEVWAETKEVAMGDIVTRREEGILYNQASACRQTKLSL